MYSNVYYTWHEFEIKRVQKVPDATAINFCPINPSGKEYFLFGKTTDCLDAECILIF